MVESEENIDGYAKLPEHLLEAIMSHLVQGRGYISFPEWIFQEVCKLSNNRPFIYNYHIHHESNERHINRGLRFTSSSCTSDDEILISGFAFATIAVLLALLTYGYLYYQHYKAKQRAKQQLRKSRMNTVANKAKQYRVKVDWVRESFNLLLEKFNVATDDWLRNVIKRQNLNAVISQQGIGSYNNVSQSMTLTYMLSLDSRSHTNDKALYSDIHNMFRNLINATYGANSCRFKINREINSVTIYIDLNNIAISKNLSFVETCWERRQVKMLRQQQNSSDFDMSIYEYAQGSEKEVQPGSSNQKQARTTRTRKKAKSTSIASSSKGARNAKKRTVVKPETIHWVLVKEGKVSSNDDNILYVGVVTNNQYTRQKGNTKKSNQKEFLYIRWNNKTLQQQAGRDKKHILALYQQQIQSYRQARDDGVNTSFFGAHFRFIGSSNSRHIKKAAPSGRVRLEVKRISVGERLYGIEEADCQHGKDRHTLLKLSFGRHS